MLFRKIWVLRGANRWTRFPALEVEVLLEGDEATPTNALPGFVERLAGLLGTLDRQRPGNGIPGRPAELFLQQLERGASLAHLLQHLALLLQVRVGCDVAFGLARPAQPPAFYRVVIEFEEEPLGRACLEAARELCLAVLHAAPLDPGARMLALCDLAHDVRLGPSTGAIVQAARERNIPTRRLNEGSLVQLGQGIHQRRILTAETDRTGAIAEAIAQDKELTRKLLHAVGVPVPDGWPVKDAEDAWEAAQDIGVPVVVKPQDGNHGRGVATNLTTREQVVQAFNAARKESKDVLVEKFIPGEDHRFLVVGNRLVAAARREPAHVIGDGRSTVRELIEVVNRDPRRSDGHSTVLSYIKLDPVALSVLQDQGLTPDSVPAEGHRVLIRRNGNLSTGGTATDVTDEVHPEVAARAVDAARMVGLDIAGVDVVVTDVSQPLEVQGGAIVEVNAGPGLRMHLQPSAGKARAVGEAIVELLYPNGQNGRIPVVAVTGVNGKTTATRLIAHLLRTTGKVVGMACTDGAYIDLRRIEKKDCSGPRTARGLLLNPRVEAVVLETARGGMLREGLGFDRCDVAVVTNVGRGDHFGMRGVETLEDLVRIQRIVVEAVAPTGSAVLNAADPHVAGMADHCPGAVVFFARHETQTVLAAHRAAGGRAVFTRDGDIVLAEGPAEDILLGLDQVPLTVGGRVALEVENALAAVAAGWALGMPPDELRAGMASFAANQEVLPGRYNVCQVRGATVIFDYAHNPTAVEALVGSLDAFPSARRTAVFCPPSCRDADILEMGALLGGGFDRVLLYQDRDNGDRADGELNVLMKRGLANGGRVSVVRELSDEQQAIAEAFRELQAGDLLVVGLDEIEDALSWLRPLLAGSFHPSPDHLPVGS